MNILTPEQITKFEIICKKFFPEFTLKAETGNLLNDILVNSDADIYAPLYHYEEEQVNFVFGRLHYYIVNWFDDNLLRLNKSNYYLTSGSRSVIENISNILKQLQSFFNKLHIIFDIEKTYASKIDEVCSFIQNDDTCKFILPDTFTPIEQSIIDEPIFKISKKQVFSATKYLIFGVSKAKPDIRIKQVLDGDLEVINSEDMLVYDEEIGDSLLYKDFNKWWTKNKNKYSWYDRQKQLQTCELLVQNYYRKNYYKEDHPVLIPQVYLHYDPKTKAERKNCIFNEELTFQRMDFLIIYAGKRIIIELDGSSHFLVDNKVDLEKYAKQVEYDRTMKFLGYDIFRICNNELLNEKAERTLNVFFKNLYRYLGISTEENKS